MSEPTPTGSDDAGAVRNTSHGAYPWLVLGVATLAQASAAVAFLGVGILATFIQDDLGLNGLETGLLVTAVGLVPAALLIPVGARIDRVGSRWVVAAGSVALGLGMVLAATLGATYPVLLGILLAGGAGYATAQPGGSCAVAGWFRERRRGLAMGIRQTGVPVGGAVAGLFMPGIAVRHGWRPALFAAGIVALAGGILFAAVYRPHDAAASAGRLREQLPRAWRTPTMRSVLILGFAMVAAQLALVSYLLGYQTGPLRLSLSAAATSLSLAQLAGAFGRIALAAWSDRPRASAMGLAWWTILVAAAGLLALAILPADVPVFLAVGTSAALGFFQLGWYGPWVTHIVHVSSPGLVGTTLGIAITANQLGIVAGPPLFGAILDATGSYRIGWAFFAGLLLASAVLIRITDPPERWREAEAEPVSSVVAGGTSSPW